MTAAFNVRVESSFDDGKNVKSVYKYDNKPYAEKCETSAVNRPSHKSFAARVKLLLSVKICQKINA